MGTGLAIVGTALMSHMDFDHACGLRSTGNEVVFLAICLDRIPHWSLVFWVKGGFCRVVEVAEKKLPQNACAEAWINYYYLVQTGGEASALHAQLTS